MIGKWIRSLPFIFANKNYTLTLKKGEITATLCYMITPIGFFDRI